MSLPARVTTLVIAFLAVVAGGIFVALHYIGSQPPTVDYTSVASNGQVNVTLMTTPQTTVTDKPDWVSYFIKNPSTGQFVHTTYFKVPADTQVNITILGYDGCTPLRNPLWGQVTGTFTQPGKERGRRLDIQRQEVLAGRRRCRRSTRGRTARSSTRSRSPASD